MRKLLLGLFLTSATVCLSAQSSSSKNINKDYDKDKTLVFAYNTSSVENFNVEGPHAGIFVQPDVKKNI